MVKEREARHGTFEPGRPGWLGGLDHVRNVVRQEMIARQLAHHLPNRPLRILDVGAGQGTQSIRLARLGHHVLAIEPDPQMRDAFRSSLTGESTDVQDRVALREGKLGSLADVVGGQTFDLAMLLGVLMYLPSSRPAIAELAPHVSPGGLLALAVRTNISAVWRPAARQDWPAALDALDEQDAALRDGRDVRYINEIGTSARADNLDALVAAAASHGLELKNWYGVRIAVDMAEHDPVAPTDPEQLAAMFDVEERLGSTDPYRQFAQLAHLVLEKADTFDVVEDQSCRRDTHQG